MGKGIFQIAIYIILSIRIDIVKYFLCYCYRGEAEAHSILLQPEKGRFYRRLKRCEAAEARIMSEWDFI